MSNTTLENVEGQVKWFDPRKGFGFIVGPQGQDIFVHFSVIDQEGGFRTLNDAEMVVYSATEGAKGWAATKARSLTLAFQPLAAAHDPSLNAARLMHIELFRPLLYAGLFPARHLRVSGVLVDTHATGTIATLGATWHPVSPPTTASESLPGWAVIALALGSALCIVALAWWIPYRMMRVQRAQVRHAERTAAESARNAEIASMTRGLAHEIKNPLSTVVLNAQLLREEILESPLDETDRASMSRRVDTLAREAARLRDILTDFLRYAGRMQLDRRHCDLRDAVTEISDFFMPQAEQAGVRFVVDMDRHPVIVDADPSLLKQALLNLLLNSVQAMQDLPEDRARTLKLSVYAEPPESRSENPRCAAIDAEDTGPGLTPEMRQHAFEPYHTTKPGGNGLGLATARRIIEAHGGSIEALDASDGHGARFRITLPLAETASDAPAPR